MAREVTATELKNHTGQVLEQAQREDVIISRQGRPYAALVAWSDYEELQGLRHQRNTRRRLTPERLKEILAELAELGQRGEQQVDLSEFVAKDRLEH